MTDRPKLTEAQERKLELMPKARQWRREGYSLRQISEALGVGYVTVFNWTKDVKKGDIYNGIE